MLQLIQVYEIPVEYSFTKWCETIKIKNFSSIIFFGVTINKAIASNFWNTAYRYEMKGKAWKVTKVTRFLKLYAMDMYKNVHMHIFHLCL